MKRSVLLGPGNICSDDVTANPAVDLLLISLFLNNTPDFFYQPVGKYDYIRTCAYLWLKLKYYTIYV